MSFWKQLFCEHLWQDVKETFLRDRKDIDNSFHLMVHNTFKYFAIEQTCFKCNKKRIISKRILQHDK
jgi:hypothetical protein